MLFHEIALRKRTALDPAALVPFGGGTGFRIRGLVFRGRAYRAAVTAGVGPGMRSGAGVSGKREEGREREDYNGKRTEYAHQCSNAGGSSPGFVGNMFVNRPSTLS